MKLRLDLTRSIIRPVATAGDHDGGRPEDLLELHPCRGWRTIAFDAEREAVGKATLGGRSGVVERSDWGKLGCDLLSFAPSEGCRHRSLENNLPALNLRSKGSEQSLPC